MPVPKPPSAWTDVLALCGYANVAVICFAATFTAVTVTVSAHGWMTTQGVGPPTSTTSCSPTKKPVIVAGTAPLTLTPTVCAPIGTAAANVTAARQRDLAGLSDLLLQQLGRAANAGVELRAIPDGRCELVICSSAEVTALEMMSRIVTEISNSGSENPACEERLDE